MPSNDSRIASSGSPIASNHSRIALNDSPIASNGSRIASNDSPGANKTYPSVRLPGGIGISGYFFDITATNPPLPGTSTFIGSPFFISDVSTA
ncbi:MAG: hypothetical protein HC906_08785, partial [Bacteroidales bacterium]|nr:hypothetical protein [Bacteroidales bacterium]